MQADDLITSIVLKPTKQQQSEAERDREKHRGRSHRYTTILRQMHRRTDRLTHKGTEMGS